MANINNPHGLRPLGISMSGGPPVIDTFKKLVGLASAIYRWDPIARLADASVSAWGGSTPDITPGTSLYSGVAMNYSPASTAAEIHAVVNPDAMFEAQVDGSGLVEADLGLNANLVYAAGNTLTKISKWQVASSTAATTATLDVHLLALFSDAVNAFGQYARFEVVFNKHRMNAGVAGV